MKKLFLLGLCLALLGGVACADETTQPRAFDDAQDSCTYEKAIESLEMTVSGPTTLTRGSVAEFEVKVVRSADLDPQKAQDLPKANRRAVDPVDAAVEGALVAVSLSVADGTPMGDMAVTDDHGVATLEIRVKGSTPNGTADATGFAWREVFEGPCVRVAETGSYHQEAAATIE